MIEIIRKIFKKILSLTVLPILRNYLKKPRKYKYQDIELIIQPGVFHPGFFFSTQFLLNYLKKIPLKKKIFLELGAGSALLSFYANKQGAIVTASDINLTAVQAILKNQENNKQKFNAIHSDLFEKIPKQKFDCILINPPYYKKKPKTESDFAWYCGENLEYFVRLFDSIKENMHSDTLVLMVLSEDCALNEIKEIALQNKIKLKVVAQKNIWLEENYIFQIHLADQLDC